MFEIFGTPSKLCPIYAQVKVSAKLTAIFFQNEIRDNTVLDPLQIISKLNTSQLNEMHIADGCEQNTIECRFVKLFDFILQ